MGKYMKKGKIRGDIAVMEVPQPTSSLGVRTRARTLALQPSSEVSYLQLRSRRLEKSTHLTQPKPKPKKVEGHFRHFDGKDEGVVVEPSCGDNCLDFDPSRERSTRESTPCSLIRDAETIGTPGSTTRPTCSASANRRAQNTQRAIPTTPEMEEFFAGFELHQRTHFIEKYNYDIMNDLPLPGRYEWLRVDNSRGEDKQL